MPGNLMLLFLQKAKTKAKTKAKERLIR